MWRALPLLALLSVPADAQLVVNPCIQNGLAGFVDNLRARYREHKIAEAVTAGGERLVIFVSAAGTWTMLAVTGAGLACLLSAGDGFVFIRAPGEPS